MIYVPKSIGLCVDGFGFMGILDLRAYRQWYGVREYLGVIKDRVSRAYLVGFFHNENVRGDEFVLKRVDSVHSSGVYHVSDNDSMGGVDVLESYVLFLDDLWYCYLDTHISGVDLPEVLLGNRRWRFYYEVVRAPKRF